MAGNDSVPSVSVVIPAFDAAATIGAQLDAIARQAYPGTVEVVIADNGSRDGTREVAEHRASSFASLRVIDAGDARGPAHARNRGIEAASHEFVFGCDADDQVEPGWIAALVEALTDADLVGGAMRDAGSDPGSDWLLGTAGLGFLPGCNGANFAVRRSVWQQVGGFAEDLPTCEDIDFAWRVQLAGFRFEPQPDAVTWYRVPETRRATLRKWFAYGRYQPTLYARHCTAGFVRPSVPRALAHDLLLLVRCYRLLGPEKSWRAWCVDFAKRAGRAVGSVEAGQVLL